MTIEGTRRARAWAIAGLLCALAVTSDAAAFPHIVRAGETVAEIAERMYGRVELERVIVVANGLGGRRGSAIVPGQRLEIPAVGYHKVLPGDTWQSVADATLGDAKRGDVLARLNDSQPWLEPEVSREIVIPYNLRFVASLGDTTQSLAYRFLERRDEAWVIASYNRLDRARLRQGEIVLVPLTDLTLTAAGKQAALDAGALVRSEGGGAALEAQQKARTELPRLATDIRRGRYIEAVARGSALLARGGLSAPQLAETQRYLTEAYVALDAPGLAANACAEWRRHDPGAVLDPIELSPKIIDACVEDEAERTGPVVGDGGVVR
ncbi:MAG TPA: LysM domain-containing protein [Polyangiaceae bacterium]|nr:LysM domain-containing protein [Polyangiaceae bacterium]